MLPSVCKPVPAADLVRLGADRDGGYIVSRSAVKQADLLLSFGLNDDWRFERAFQSLGGGRVVCFDHSVTGRFWVLYTLKQVVRLRLAAALKYLGYRRYFARQDAEHRRIRIGYDAPGEASLASLLGEFQGNNLFLKCDIEGAEYRILDDIVANADRFTGMVFEFHDIDLNRRRLEDFVSALPGFKVIDLHANNYGGVDPAGDPLFIELSLVREDLFQPAPGSVAPVMAMHTANDPAKPDIELAFAS